MQCYMLNIMDDITFSKLKNPFGEHFCKEVKLKRNPSLFKIFKKISQLEK